MDPFDSSYFNTPAKQLPGQDQMPFEPGRWKLPLKSQKSIMDTRYGRPTEVGFWDVHNQPVMHTDMFNIPERAKPQGEQLGFDSVEASQGQLPSRAFIPNNEALHQLRLANPKLNDYQFNLYGGSEKFADNQVTVNHKPFTTAVRPKPVTVTDRRTGKEINYSDPGGKRMPAEFDVAEFDWKNVPDYSPTAAEVAKHGNREYGEIKYVNVSPKHQGAGLATAAYDYAMAQNDLGRTVTAPRHSNNRSMTGDIWARRVGGILPEREHGHSVREYDLG